MADYSKDLAASFSEFIGTAYFVFFGVGGSVALTNNIKDTNPGVALIAGPLAWGFSLLVTVWVMASSSGGVLNPAITIGLMATKDIRLIRGFLYIIAQFLGALLGAYLIEVVQPGQSGGATTLASGTTVMEGLLLEIFCTSILTFAVYILAIDENSDCPALGIGWALFISAIAAGPYTGGSLNPARTFGPALVTGDYGTANWIYYLGPILGALLASAFVTILRKMGEYKEKRDEKLREKEEKLREKREKSHPHEFRSTREPKNKAPERDYDSGIIEITKE
ncbi:aquaporin-like protein [Gigaspora rosea]|uniref:Aquaporin-like protein n=1 Tax=Gigaspora rosea TaxID=44941 RepID=A0A397UPG8_9GLOM|nr:aquaporin-like protein [Gigaspora rosea]